MDSYCPHQCAIWAWNTDTQNWVKDCVRPGWTVAGEYTYPSPMSYETVVCMRDYGHDGWTQWVPEDENSSNKLGTARLGHPASHEGAPTVSGFMDSYCPHQCAIWAWNTDTQNWVKDCVRAGWTVAGEYTYPNPMNYETVVCMQILRNLVLVIGGHKTLRVREVEELCAVSGVTQARGREWVSGEKVVARAKVREARG